MPLSCKGRYRNVYQSRGDIDDVLGNYTLTLVDTLDTLAVLGKLDEFEQAVKNVIETTKFDRDITISVFEANIRMIGGLLGGHVSAIYLKEKYPQKIFKWYKNELLEKAKELGYKLLPAFNTSSGLPLPRINLKYGITDELRKNEKEKFTCTACAGTLILEFAALSRLTGDMIFEEKAKKTLDFIWEKRNRLSDLVGMVLNVHTGDWTVKDSSIGAGIDSYYEYLFKGYMLIGDETLLQRFNKHYESIMKFMAKQHGFMQTVHMHMPYRQARGYMDALLAFWPGLQVLKGDIRKAIEMHENLYQIVKKHKFLPEAFLSDHSIHWSNSPLRPEFAESTYYLYKATNDPYYLNIGKEIVDHFETHARVKCGYAAFSDLETTRHEDRIDSFVYAETFKYLYLLFEEESNLEIDLNDFIFTTEAHLLPLSLSNVQIKTNKTENKLSLDIIEPHSQGNSCPNLNDFLKNNHYEASRIRKAVNSKTPIPSDSCDNNVFGNSKFKYEEKIDESIQDIKVKASEFVMGNPDQIQKLGKMGIKIKVMNDGRIQLVQLVNEAENAKLAENGLAFMSDMLELSKQKNFQITQISPENSSDYKPINLAFISNDGNINSLLAGPAQFGPTFDKLPKGLFAYLEISNPIDACSNIINTESIANRIVVVKRGNCMFIEKVHRLMRHEVKGVIIIDSNPNTTYLTSPLFAMSGDGNTNSIIKIPSVFLFSIDGDKLLNSFESSDKKLLIFMGAYNEANQQEQIKNVFYETLDNLREETTQRNCQVKRNIFTIEKKICLANDYDTFYDYFSLFDKQEEDFFNRAEIYDDSISVLIDDAKNIKKLVLKLEALMLDKKMDLSKNKMKSDVNNFVDSMFMILRNRFETKTNILNLKLQNEYFRVLRIIVDAVFRYGIDYNKIRLISKDNIILRSLANELKHFGN